MDNLQIISSNLTKLKNLAASVNSYYVYASTNFFTGFGEEELENFKVMKNFLDKVEIEITKSSNEIMAYALKDERLKNGIHLLIQEKKYSPLKELASLSNLRTLKISTDSLDTEDFSIFKDLIIEWANTPIQMVQALTRYNENLLFFRAIQTEQYEIMGTLSKALFLFFNYQNSSRMLKNYIIQLDLRPIIF